MTALVLQAAAITLVFTLGSLFERVRQLWPSFLGCPLCAGVWIGAGVAVADGIRVPLQVLGIGALSGVVALAAARVLEALDAYAVAAEGAAKSRKEADALLSKLVPAIEGEIVPLLRRSRPQPPGGLS